MGRVFLIGVIFFAGLLVFGAIAPATAPLTITSPDSGSMEPTAPEHSLVVVVDKSPSVGDIAMYDSPTRQDPVLHRLVGVTEDGGFESQGDANPQTDQETGEPPVTADDLYGVVPTIFGAPLIIPYAGLILTNPVFIIGVWALFGLSLLYSTDSGKVTRGVVSDYPAHLYAIGIGVVVLILLPIVVLTTPYITGVELLTSTTVSAEASHIVSPGEATFQEVTITSPLLTFLHVTTHSTGDIQISNVESDLGSNTATVTVTHEPSQTPEVHTGDIIMYAYPPVLPSSIIRELAAIHPIVAAIGSSAVIGIPMIVLGLLMDTNRLNRARNASIYSQRRITNKNKRND